MGSKIERAREAVVEFFKTANPQDEFFMITFADRPEQIADFSDSVDDIQGRLLYTVPKGRTALLDAIYLGVSKMRQAKYPKKALLIISDGGDNHSRYTEGEIRSMVKEADILIYAIGIYDHYFPTEEERLGPTLLSDVTELTGGRAFTIDNPNDLADVSTKIGIELRNQYVIGYRPKNPARDGKWRKIKVKLLPPKGLPPLKVYAKTGYYAPTNRIRSRVGSTGRDLVRNEVGSKFRNWFFLPLLLLLASLVFSQDAGTGAVAAAPGSTPAAVGSQASTDSSSVPAASPTTSPSSSRVSSSAASGAPPPSAIEGSNSKGKQAGIPTIVEFSFSVSRSRKFCSMPPSSTISSAS